ncbi:hypothetical protein JHK87_000418 [Glycine soja]|nr:hypothetical protein JHK87_000418 [Glycine soja]
MPSVVRGHVSMAEPPPRGHPSGQCFMLGGSLEEFNYMGNQNRQGNYGNPPYNNIFNLWWRNNNLGWKQDVGPFNRPLPYGY